MSREPVITVLGVGADLTLESSARALLAAADVVLGGRRHLAALDASIGESSTQQRISWPSPLADQLPALLAEHRGRRVVALASGDPLVSGIGGTLIRLLGADAVRIVPAISSVALARAAMGWTAEESEVLTLVGRDVDALRRAVAPNRRLLVLTSGPQTPAEIGGILAAVGHGSAALTVLSDLGTADEARSTRSADAWTRVSSDDVPTLHVVAVETSPDTPYLSAWVAGLPDDAFENDGQLTKRDLRASALARLAPAPGQHLWDVGAGAGSVGIEWMRAHPTCRTTAVEANSERAARIASNARALGVPGLSVVEAKAPDALAALETPDAIFIGGGATRPGVLDACLGALGPGGRLVVHGVTLETEQLLADAYRTHGGELTRIAVESTAPVGTFTGWTPARTVTQWAWQR
ncbi:bifunctional cobalt-precorrin-7 (C(5))-methyltransferase/cobalt-precorrin-6B (C(15))-methyltransferase [Nocardioides dubius]|uniref:Bifunctional cobalt-precorrin-7 (C(5))-methyltransferase/cobalt-precorrin-6B (C(15))-methyltransferase n=1 Tax=Nocardioides dubius TaxID=317019 RepID=A0ABN1TP45_9ACTN